MRKAFTLIELLVVIAIIAILAAILFPVFAQAKAAAKRTASLSTAKQASVAMFMYTSTNNDVFTPGDSYGGRTTDGGILSDNPAVLYRNWMMLLQPLIKNDEMLNDPLATKFDPNTTAGLSTAANYIKSFYAAKCTSWGYNKDWLDQTFLVNGEWQHNVKSQGSLGNPAQTVMIVSGWALNDSTLLYNQYYSLGGRRSMTQAGLADAPLCTTIAQGCFDNWGASGSFWNGFLKNKWEAGAFTGGVAPRANDGAITVFADGHASRLPMGKLADGTNWNKTIAAGSLAMVDDTRYIWDDK